MERQHIDPLKESKEYNAPKSVFEGLVDVEDILFYTYNNERKEKKPVGERIMEVVNSCEAVSVYVFGPPGSGKTTISDHIIHEFESRGKRVRTPMDYRKVIDTVAFQFEPKLDNIANRKWNTFEIQTFFLSLALERMRSLFEGQQFLMPDVRSLIYNSFFSSHVYPLLFEQAILPYLEKTYPHKTSLHKQSNLKKYLDTTGQGEFLRFFREAFMPFYSSQATEESMMSMDNLINKLFDDVYAKIREDLTKTSVFSRAKEPDTKPHVIPIVLRYSPQALALIDRIAEWDRIAGRTAIFINLVPDTQLVKRTAEQRLAILSWSDEEVEKNLKEQYNTSVVFNEPQTVYLSPALKGREIKEKVAHAAHPKVVERVYNEIQSIVSAVRALAEGKDSNFGSAWQAIKLIGLNDHALKRIFFQSPLNLHPLINDSYRSNPQHISELLDTMRTLYLLYKGIETKRKMEDNVFNVANIYDPHLPVTWYMYGQTENHSSL